MNIGKISENVLVRSVFKNIDKVNKTDIGAAVGTDCAFFCDTVTAVGYVSGIAVESESKECITPAGLAIHRACNNIAASGAVADTVTLSVSLPENYREIKLKSLMQDANKVAGELHIKIAGGHTETVVDIKTPVISAFAIGHKIVGKDAAIDVTSHPGQYIVMTKWMAINGTVALTREFFDKLRTKLPSFLLKDALYMQRFLSVVPEAAVAVNHGDLCMHDCSDGGVFAALWQLAERDNVGLEVDLRTIPVRQETIEVAEFFDINPYKLNSQGSLLIVTDTPKELISELAKEEILGTCIGRITDGHDKVIVMNEERRFLESPRQDEIVNIWYNVD